MEKMALPKVSFSTGGGRERVKKVDQRDLGGAPKERKSLALF